MEYAVILTPSCFIPECKVTITVPDGRDAEEYIDEYLDAVLSDDLRFNATWEIA